MCGRPPPIRLILERPKSLPCHVAKYGFEPVLGRLRHYVNLGSGMEVGPDVTLSEHTTRIRRRTSSPPSAFRVSYDRRFNRPGGSGNYWIRPLLPIACAFHD